MSKLTDTDWDVIIIGAGSTGCVLANKLSKDESRRVLLIEAGPKNNHPYITIPAAVASAIESPKFNWHYRTTPQKHLNNRRLTTPRGKVLGGSSSINALVYIRGHAKDYDHWQEQGCAGWSYSDVLPYFIKTENNELANSPLSENYHGHEGELYVGNPESGNPMFKAFIKAGEQLGYPRNSDFNGAVQEGFGDFQLNIKDGKRYSAADAFLSPVKHRRNLTVITRTHVSKVLFSGTRASGVECVINKQKLSLKASKVILSSGAIGSPHLLLLSGIGEPTELQKHNIPCVSALPGVGKNLHDHLEVKVKCRINQPLSLGKYQSVIHRFLAATQYLVTGRGVCRQQGLEAGAFLSLNTDAIQPDTQLHFINALAFDGAKPEDRGHGFAIDVTPLQPESRGQITLASDDPMQAPLINPNYLAVENDRRMLREGLKLLRELCDQDALKRYIETELFPGPAIIKDGDLDALIQSSAESIYHPVGTAKMGVDEMAVVNPNTMQVHGTEGLYVADASVMPRIVSGNTHAASVMIGAKAADLIGLEDS